MMRPICKSGARQIMGPISIFVDAHDTGAYQLDLRKISPRRLGAQSDLFTCPLESTRFQSRT